MVVVQACWIIQFGVIGGFNLQMEYLHVCLDGCMHVCMWYTRSRYGVDLSLQIKQASCLVTRSVSKVSLNLLSSNLFLPLTRELPRSSICCHHEIRVQRRGSDAWIWRLFICNFSPFPRLMLASGRAVALPNAFLALGKPHERQTSHW